MTATPETWPLPRRKRNVPSASLAYLAEQEGAGEITIPRPRFFTAQIATAGVSRKTVSTPLLVGPAMILNFDYVYSAAGDPPGGSLEIGWAIAPVTENNVALTTPKPYTVLSERIDPFAMSASNIGQGILTRTLNNARQKYWQPARFLVTAPSFAFTFALIETLGLAENCFVTCSIIEAIPASDLADYMKSG